MIATKLFWGWALVGLLKCQLGIDILVFRKYSNPMDYLAQIMYLCVAAKPFRYIKSGNVH